MATTDSAARSGRSSRARIVEVALEHFAAHGYRGTSLARIAKEAGLSQPGILHHFPTKAALLGAVLTERDKRDLAAVGLSDDEMADLDFPQALEVLEKIAARNVNNRNLVQFAHLVSAEATGGDHPAYEWVTVRTAYVRTFVTSAIRRSIEAGQLVDGVDPDRIGTLVVGVLEGLENQWLVDPDIDMVGSFQSFVEMLRASLEVPVRQ